MKCNFLISTVLLLIGLNFTVYGQTLEEQVETKIDSLESLILTANENGIDTQKEEMIAYTAKLFIEFAKVDEQSVSENTKYYGWHPTYKDDAQKLAEELPDFEREKTIELLETTISHLHQVISKDIVRPVTPLVDYSNIVRNENHLTQNGKTVFLMDYVWKPDDVEEDTKKYFGAYDGEYLTPSYLNEDLTYKEWAYNSIGSNDGQNIGSVFIDNNNIPSWAYQKYDNFDVGSRHYGKYDVDHPGAKELYGKMFEHFVPLIQGKKFTKLGYMLFNEPSFFTKEGVWNSGEVSEYTKIKFRTWLSNQHNSIADLNAEWGSSFASFDDVDVQIPMSGDKQGSPIWFDWMRFNQNRITDWFAWVRQEIRKYDPDAKVHIKLMPWLWVDNARDHGMDFEALIRLTDIIGVDADARNAQMWGDNNWEDRYAMEWLPTTIMFDFFKSVQPNQFIYDSENHYLTSVSFMLKEIDPEYVNSIYWLGHLHGLSATSNWVWSRLSDGKIDSKRPEDSGYIVDVTHQPKVLAQVQSTMMDLNSFGDEVFKIQSAQKPIRIFYSETTAINRDGYMEDDIHNVYQKLYFEGIPIGFATEDIIKEEKDEWDVILVYNTESVKESEIDALQSFIDAGGKVIVDANSLKKNEYGKSHTKTLNGAQQSSSLGNMTNLAISNVKEVPNVEVVETNTSIGKGCFWRTIKSDDGKQILALVNLGNTDAEVTVNLKNATKGTFCFDLMTGKALNNQLVLSPYQVYFLELRDEKTISPSVGFITPDDGESILVNTIFKVEGTASISEGTIEYLRLFIDGNFYGERTTPPYVWEEESFQNLPAKNHVLTLVATSDKGVETETEIEISIECEGLSNEVLVDGNTLTAVQEGATYQWINCSTQQEIIGQTSSSFSPVANGTYAVRISNDVCETLSDCFDMTITSIDNDCAITPKVFPNPAKELVTIDFGKNYDTVELKLFNPLGSTLINKKLTSRNKYDLGLSTFSKGVYIIQLSTPDYSKSIRLIKE
ncbi:T9SS type A sorting domain-containing protein [Flammeovirga sp. MY04]|uniref:T9SS type A sorting domain-containing protein n=1 Tax=Flammeovirga sp. MY04 TaxID=1191459 RepID=UPI0008062ABE|nr:T9SS type A sorting domain-containing protein [Flammeovirga sp. MY04]ANQ47440.1 T9SS type A sorting domain-containing protein [Flammeovirga sp. MY04]